MRTFLCFCGNKLFFENTRCQVCGRVLGYLPNSGLLSAMEPLDAVHWQALPAAAEQSYRMCANYAQENVCNWMVAADDADPFCLACRLNETIPNLSAPYHRLYWAKIEASKRHLFYTLYGLGLPIFDRRMDPKRGLAFAFLADTPVTDESLAPNYAAESITTGHARGLITINLAEADDAARARMRERMKERYRTLLGHFRHEIGHYYWDLLVRDSAWLAPFRTHFGDERRDYSLALTSYYDHGPPDAWQNTYISAYATAHPWEDWAETWAHYLLLTDTLETAYDLGFMAEADKAPASALVQTVPKAQHCVNSAEDCTLLLDNWTRLTLAINAINRSRGLPDAYSFLISDPARNKLRFVHDLILAHRSSTVIEPSA